MPTGTSTRRYTAACSACGETRVTKRSDFSLMCHRCTVKRSIKQRRQWCTPNMRAYMKAYRQQHHERLVAQFHAWRERNVEHERLYRQKHMAKTSEQARGWARKNRARWLYLKNKHQRAREARKRGCETALVDYNAIWKRDRGMCGICKHRVRDRTKAHFDHIIPLALKGPHTAPNIQVAHARCNMSKGMKIPTKLEEMV